MPKRAKMSAASAGLSETQQKMESQSASRRRKASTKYDPTAVASRTAQASAAHTADSLGGEAEGWCSARQHQQQGSQAQGSGQGYPDNRLEHAGSIKGPQAYLQLLKSVSYQSQQSEPQQTDQILPNQRGPATVLAHNQQQRSEIDNLAQQGSQQQQQQPRRRGWPKGKPRKQASAVNGTSLAIRGDGNAADLALVIECKDTAARSTAVAECKDAAAAVATATPSIPLTELQEMQQHNSPQNRADLSRRAVDQPVLLQQQQHQQRDERTESSGTSHHMTERQTHETAASTDSPSPSRPSYGPGTAAVAAPLVAGRVPNDNELQAFVSRKLSQTASSQLQGLLQQHQRAADLPYDDHSPKSDQSLLPADEALMAWPLQMQQQQQIGMRPAAAATAAAAAAAPRSASKHTESKVSVKLGHGSRGDNYQPTYKVGHRHVVMCKQSNSDAAAAAAAAAATAGSCLTVTPRPQTEFFDRYPLPKMQCNPHSGAVLAPSAAAAAAAAADVMPDADLIPLRSHTRAQAFKPQQQQQQQQQRRQQHHKKKEKEMSAASLQGLGVPACHHQKQTKQQQQQQQQNDSKPQVPDTLAQLADHLRHLSGGANEHYKRTNGVLAWQQQQQQTANGMTDPAYDHPLSSGCPIMQTAAVPATTAPAVDLDPGAAAGQSGKFSQLERQASAGADLVAEALLQLQQQAAAAPLEGVSDGSCASAEALLQLPAQRSWPGRQQQQQQQHCQPSAKELHLPSLGAVFGGAAAAAAAANPGSSAAAAVAANHGAMPVNGTQHKQKARDSSSRRKLASSLAVSQAQPQHQQQQKKKQSTGTPTLLQQLLAKREQAKQLAPPGAAAAAAAADSGGSFGLSVPACSRGLAPLFQVGSLSAPNNSSSSLQAPQQVAITAAAAIPPKSTKAASLATELPHRAADLATDYGSTAAAVGVATAAAAAAAAEVHVEACRIPPGHSISTPAASAATAAKPISPNQLSGQQHAQQQQQQQLIQLQEVMGSMLSIVQKQQSQLQNVTRLLQQQQQQQCNPGLGFDGGRGASSDVMAYVHDVWEQQPQHAMSLLLSHQELGRILMPQPHKQQQQQHKRLHDDWQQQQPSKRPSLDQSQKMQPSLLQHHNQQVISSLLEGVVEVLPDAAAAAPPTSAPTPPDKTYASATQHTKVESHPATAATAGTAAGSGATLRHVSMSAADMAEANIAYDSSGMLQQHSQNRLQVSSHPATGTLTDGEEPVAVTGIAVAAGGPRADHTGTRASELTAAAAAAAGGGGVGGDGVACIGERTDHIRGAVTGPGHGNAAAAAPPRDPAAAAEWLLLLAKQLLQQLQQFPAGLTTPSIRKLLLQRAAVTTAAAAAAVTAGTGVAGRSAFAAGGLEDRQVDCMVQQLLAARLIKQQQQQEIEPSAQGSGSSSSGHNLLVVTEAGRRILKLNSWWDCAQTIVTYLGDHGNLGLCKDYLSGLVLARVDYQVIEGALRLCQILGLVLKTEAQQLEDGGSLALALSQEK